MQSTVLYVENYMRLNSAKIFLLVLLAFIAGVGLASFGDIPDRIAQISFWGLGMAVVIVGIFNKRRAIPLFFILAALAGVVRFNITKAHRAQLLEFTDVNFPVTLRGYLDAEPQWREKNQLFILRAKEIILPGHRVLIDERILITTNLYPRYSFGKALEIKGKLQKPEAFEDFDYPVYLAKDDIYFLSYFPQIQNCSAPSKKCLPKLSWQDKARLFFGRPIFSFKQRFESAISRAVPEPNASFLQGIVLGSRSGMPEGLKEDFRRTGTSHIFAISGWNITVLSQIIGGFFLIFFMRKTAFWFTLGAIGVFVILTGASASVMRAAVMGILVLLARRQGRLYQAVNAIVFAGAIMILINPKVLRFDVGFQLSFLATLGLIYISPLLEEKLSKMREFFGMKESLIATLSAAIAILPVAISHFNQLSLAAIPVNMLVLPVVPWAMLAGFLAGIAGLGYDILGQAFGWIAWLFSAYTIGIIRLFARLPFGSFPLNLHWVFTTPYYAVLVYFLTRTKNKV